MTFISSYRPGLYAAVDIGTVTCRLLIARVDANGILDEIVRETNICNLGVGVDETHVLQESALDRTVAVLSRYSTLIQDMNTECERSTNDESHLICVRTIATSASRDAKNANEFQRRVAEQTILNLEVIPGEQEAALSFKGASAAFPGERVVVVDIGGGSTEIVAGLSGHAPEFRHSFDIGCRRITERFLKSDPPSKQELLAAHEFVTQTMRPYLDMLKDHGCFQGRTVAVAGTATSAVSIRDHMVVYDPQKVHGSEVTREDIDALLARLADLPLAERKNVVGLEPERAAVAVAGLIILQVIMELASLESITVSEYDILQGIILDNACS